MSSKVLAQLLADLGVTKTHSRPHVSNDNPFSESGFKTMKYRPDFPDCFGSLEDARRFCIDYFDWYNNHHHHSGLGFLTPAQVHHGLAAGVLAQRQSALERAYEAHPERFPGGPPSAAAPPSDVWINPPQHVTLVPANELRPLQ
jgi:putative transposase